jgi:hypothetical protein
MNAIRATVVFQRFDEMRSIITFANREEMFDYCLATGALLVRFDEWEDLIAEKNNVGN